MLAMCKEGPVLSGSTNGLQGLEDVWGTALIQKQLPKWGLIGAGKVQQATHGAMPGEEEPGSGWCQQRDRTGLLFEHGVVFLQIKLDGEGIPSRRKWSKQKQEAGKPPEYV